MRSTTLGRSVELLKIAGTPSEVAMISGLGARAGMAIGILLPAVLVLHPNAAAAFTAGCSVFALVAGLFLMRYPAALPLPLLDGLLVVADSLLALLGIYNDEVQPALPGIYVVIGTIVFAVRSWPVAAVHGALLGSSYGSVILLGPTHSDPAVRWVSVLAAIAAAGLFIRWLVEQVMRLAGAETASRAAAEEATRDLRKLSEMRSAFLARMSHELRTPLNAVLGFSDLLAERLVGPLNDRQLEYTHDISAAARHQVELVDEVLDLAKVESGLHELNPEPLELGRRAGGGDPSRPRGRRTQRAAPAPAPRPGPRPGTRRPAAHPAGHRQPGRQRGEVHPGRRRGRGARRTGRRPGLDHGPRHRRRHDASRTWPSRSRSSPGSTRGPRAPGSACRSPAGSSSCTAGR